MAAAEPARVKQDRDEVFVEYTKSICPVCKVVVDAQVNIRGRPCRRGCERTTSRGAGELVAQVRPSEGPHSSGGRQ